MSLWVDILRQAKGRSYDLLQSIDWPYNQVVPLKSCPLYITDVCGTK